MDYRELIEKLRSAFSESEYELERSVCESAADAVEILLAERDAAINILHGTCYSCKNKETHYYEEPCSLCKWGGIRHTVPIAKLQDSWKWRGPQKESENNGKA